MKLSTLSKISRRRRSRQQLIIGSSTVWLDVVWEQRTVDLRTRHKTMPCPRETTWEMHGAEIHSFEIDVWPYSESRISVCSTKWVQQNEPTRRELIKSRLPSERAHRKEKNHSWIQQSNPNNPGYREQDSHCKTDAGHNEIDQEKPEQEHRQIEMKNNFETIIWGWCAYWP